MALYCFQSPSFPRKVGTLDSLEMPAPVKATRYFPDRMRAPACWIGFKGSLPLRVSMDREIVAI